MKGYSKRKFTRDEIEELAKIAGEVVHFYESPKSKQFTRNVTKFSRWFGNEYEVVSNVPKHLANYFKPVIIDSDWYGMDLSFRGKAIIELVSLIQVDSEPYLDNDLCKFINWYYKSF